MKEADANLCIIGMEFSGDRNFILQPDAGKKLRVWLKGWHAKAKPANIMTAPFIIDADTTLWSKVYRKDMLEKYVGMLPEFAPDLKVCEDFPATVMLLMKDAKIVANPDIFYGFYKRSDSITFQATVANFERDRIQFIKMTQQIVDENRGEFFGVAPYFIKSFVKAKYDIISGIVENKVKNGDLPADYGKEKISGNVQKGNQVRFFGDGRKKQCGRAAARFCPAGLFIRFGESGNGTLTFDRRKNDNDAGIDKINSGVRQ